MCRSRKLPIKREWLEELEKCANRDAASAFFEGEPSYEEQMYGVHGRKTSTDFIGLVMDYNDETKMVTLQQRNYFTKGQEVEFFGPGIENFRMTITNYGMKRGTTWM